jgi:hypothetical protein
MPDLMPYAMGCFYGLTWFGVARAAVATRRVIQRDRSTRVIVMRLARWRDC